MYVFTVRSHMNYRLYYVDVFKSYYYSSYYILLLISIL